MFCVPAYPRAVPTVGTRDVKIHMISLHGAGSDAGARCVGIGIGVSALAENGFDRLAPARAHIHAFAKRRDCTSFFARTFERNDDFVFLFITKSKFYLSRRSCF